MPNEKLSIIQNAAEVIGNTDPSYYFSQPSQLAFHNLTSSKVIPPIAKSLLGLGRNFIPTPKFTKCKKDMEGDEREFERSARLKAFFADQPLDCNPPTLYINSTWEPKRGTYPRQVDVRLRHFWNRIRLLFKKRRRCSKSNLLPFQQRILRWLKTNKELIIANTDKNLGPCAVELKR